MPHVRHAFYNILASSSAKQQLEITHIYFFDRDFQKTALCLYFSVFTSTVVPVVPCFSNIKQFKQDGIILRQLHYLREISSGEVREALRGG